MNVMYVDYTNTYYADRAKTPVPDTRTGKFVQIRNRNTEYLVFSPRDYTPYHADIVQRFCTERGIPGIYDDKKKRFVIREPEWVVVGGGKFELQRAVKLIRLYDNSMAYGRFDPEGLKEKIRSIRELSRYKIAIQ